MYRASTESSENWGINNSGETMSVKGASVKYVCPFCDQEKGNVRNMRRHITNEEDGKHRGKNGFDMSETIEVKYNGLDGSDDFSDTVKNIKKALELADRGKLDGYDEVERDLIEKIAEEAEVSKRLVRRIQKDEGYNVDYSSNTNFGWDDVSEKVKETLAYLYHTDLEKKEIAEKVGYSRGSVVNTTEKRYGWLLHKMFRPEGLENYFNNEKDEEVGAESIDKIIDSAKERGVVKCEEQEEDKEEEDMTEQDQEEDNRSNEITIETDEAFTIIKTLIESDQDEKARDMFDKFL